MLHLVIHSPDCTDLFLCILVGVIKSAWQEKQCGQFGVKSYLICYFQNEASIFLIGVVRQTCSRL